MVKDCEHSEWKLFKEVRLRYPVKRNIRFSSNTPESVYGPYSTSNNNLRIFNIMFTHAELRGDKKMIVEFRGKRYDATMGYLIHKRRLNGGKTSLYNERIIIIKEDGDYIAEETHPDFLYLAKRKRNETASLEEKFFDDAIGDFL